MKSRKLVLLLLCCILAGSTGTMSARQQHPAKKAIQHKPPATAKKASGKPSTARKGKAGNNAAPTFTPPNRIQQENGLSPFFDALQLKDQVVSVLQLGDSHVQAGFFPAALASRLQGDFGNAGRGWVFPFNLANTNGPSDYKWSSARIWDTQRIVDRSLNEAPGPGGMELTTRQHTISLQFSGNDGNAMDNTVKKATLLYYGGDDATVTAGGAQVNIQPVPLPGDALKLTDATLTFDTPVNGFTANWLTQSNANFHFYGALLQNGHPGILYSAIGVNSAMYQHYNDNSSTLTALMTVLQPQLVIISLGTNEAYGGITASQMAANIDRTVTTLRELNPNVALLLTTPAASSIATRKAYRRRQGKRYVTSYKVSYRPNTNVLVMRNAILQYAREHQLAAWDFYEQNRGMSKAFSGAWSTDHIHFNAHGYTLQGNLLYDAIHTAYQHYSQLNIKTTAGL
ncbi:GDSL-like Lipase/Acylhydrolase [Chitinophaga costaii]|uniref:GDSL-like Lipase/Acylhydrolase n=1 Tax=Chitinophaga costaii TaxID=1335309 RepID=A0A1C4F4L9_9BACT|nr:GDSL-type esterase/lipase family protein [Chitinophaga costaii]SCC50804.1 GDSL-like Lipase/Acylhydrolase [Chitinophaga costaii]